ncbi:sarcosine oxidase subunit gamma [Primorskyibacter sp. S87]|uniref:sarcosine oxidase subunit gamma n=1 Tax=Primorskyibacter sp. S87 TaxID=3415126 RepID=UPI003C7E45C2
MDKLVARTPGEGMLPLTIGKMDVKEVDPGTMTALLPFNEKEAVLSTALEQLHGMSFPAPNRATGKQGARAIWFGRGQAMLLGPEPDTSLADHAALVDQSDAWAVVDLNGDGAVDVLARLVPVDLRQPHFRRGHTVRSQLGHMTASITRLGDERFRILVFRSMIGTLIHDLKTAMEAVAAQG